MEMFEFLSHISEGAYGTVWKARNKEDGTFVAVKKMKAPPANKEDYDFAMREVQLLQQCSDHPNVVKLLEAHQSQSGRLYLVFEYVQHTVLQILQHLYAKKQGLQEVQVKAIMWQLISAVEHLHKNKVMHRDIKPSNILITGKGVVKLCDFGFARPANSAHSVSSDYTTYVVTRWYRAPEVLLGDSYGTSVDVWSLGCILAELATGTTLFPGRTQHEQLWLVLKAGGQLTRQQQALLGKDPQFACFRPPAANEIEPLEHRLRGVSPAMQQLCQACLQPDPSKRPTASQLLELPFFEGMPSLNGMQAETPLRQPKHVPGSSPGQQAPRCTRQAASSHRAHDHHRPSSLGNSEASDDSDGAAVITSRTSDGSLGIGSSTESNLALSITASAAAGAAHTSAKAPKSLDCDAAAQDHSADRSNEMRGHEEDLLSSALRQDAMSDCGATHSPRSSGEFLRPASLEAVLNRPTSLESQLSRERSASSLDGPLSKSTSSLHRQHQHHMHAAELDAGEDRSVRLGSPGGGSGPRPPSQLSRLAHGRSLRFRSSCATYSGFGMGLQRQTSEEDVAAAAACGRRLSASELQLQAPVGHGGTAQPCAAAKQQLSSSTRFRPNEQALATRRSISEHDHFSVGEDGEVARVPGKSRSQEQAGHPASRQAQRPAAATGNATLLRRAATFQNDGLLSQDERWMHIQQQQQVQQQAQQQAQARQQQQHQQQGMRQASLPQHYDASLMNSLSRARSMSPTKAAACAAAALQQQQQQQQAASSRTLPGRSNTNSSNGASSGGAVSTRGGISRTARVAAAAAAAGGSSSKQQYTQYQQPAVLLPSVMPSPSAALARSRSVTAMPAVYY